jgi:hypothetical protein
VAALNTYLALRLNSKNYSLIFIEKWIFNSIQTGCGKSLVISFIANYLAAAGRTVVILTCNQLLKSQLKNSVLEETDQNRNKIHVFSYKSEEFAELLLGGAPAGLRLNQIKEAILIVDECDVYAGIDRLLIKQGVRAEPSKDLRTYSIDMIRAFSHFAHIIGFSSKMINALCDSIPKLDKEGSLVKLAFGNLRGSGG